MASHDQRECDGPALAPHFFKIILPETLLQEKLKIPKKFVRKYGSTLLESVFLEVPSGRVWQIDLTRYDNDQVCLDNGWKPFVEYYSLSPGNLVAFRYEGSSKFCVFIYDVGSSEINYQPYDVRVNAISVENLDDSNLQTPPQKRKRTNSATETNNGVEQKKTTDLSTVKSENDAYDSPCEEQDIEGTERATNLRKAKFDELLNEQTNYQVPDSQTFPHQIPCRRDSSLSSMSFCSSGSASVDASQQPPGMSATGVVGRKWTKDEESRLVVCWLNRSSDSWAVIQREYYFGMDVAEQNQRTPKQIKDSWSRTNGRVRKFHEYWEKVNTDEQSDDQVIANAEKMYRENERPPNFAWKHWWDLVRTEPKWTGKYGFQCRSKRTTLDETGSYSPSLRNESTNQEQVQPSRSPASTNPSSLTEVRKEKTSATEPDQEMTVFMVQKTEQLTIMKRLEMVRMKTKLIEKLDELEDMDESTMTKEQLERHKRKIRRYEDVLADTCK